MDGGAAGLAIVFLVFGLAAFVFWIWTLVDVVKIPDDSMFRAGNKVVWILVVALTGVIGAIIYLAVGRPSPGARPGGTIGSTDLPPPPPGSIR